MSGTIQFDLADTSAPLFDAPIEAMLMAMLAFAPLAMGANRAWSEAIVAILALLMLAMLSLKLLCRPDVPFVRSWTYWPIALFIALVLLQIAPLPAQLVRVISPATFNLKERLLSDLPDSSQQLRWMTLSFYPEATQHALRNILVIAAVFVVVVNCIRRMSQVRRLLRAVVIVGIVLALIALVQDAFDAYRIYGWIMTPDDTPARAGPFINHGNFGQWMSMSIGAALGLALMQIHQHFRRQESYSSMEVIQKLRSIELKPAWIMLGAVVLAIAAIVMSLSRGAIVSLAIAGAIAGMLVGTRRGLHGRGWILAPALICVAVVVLLNWPSFTRQFDVTINQARRDRFETLRDLLAEWKQFPIFGAGLGTHAFVFPMFDRATQLQFSANAENEYAQLFTETGALGAAIAGAFLAMVIVAAARAIRGAISIASSAALGLTFGLIAVLAASVVNAGEHLPAVALLTAAVCALLINLAGLRARELDRVSSAPPARGSGVLRFGAMVVVCMVSAWMLVEAYTAERAELAWDAAQRLSEIAPPNYPAILNAAKEAKIWRPDDVNYHYGLEFFRWKSRSADSKRDREIVQSLHETAWLCPVFAPSYLLAYEIESQLAGLSQQASRDINFAFELGGPNADAAMLLGKFEIAAGENDLAISHLQRAVRIDPRLLPDAMRLFISPLDRPDVALAQAAGDVDALTLLARILDSIPNQGKFAEQVRERAFEATIADADRGDAPAASIERAADELAKRNLYPRAIAYFRRALALDYGQVDWRMKLAHSLEALGRDDEALHEAEICLRSRSQMPDALETISRIKARKERGVGR